MLQTTFQIPEAEIKKARSEVAKLQMIQSGGAFGKGSREAATEIYYKNNIEKTGIPYESFRHALNNTSGIKKKTYVENSDSRLPGLHFDSFKELYEAFCKEYEWVPDDLTMNKLAKLGGWAGTNAGATRKRLEIADYKFTKVLNGFTVICPIDEVTIREMIEKREKEISEAIEIRENASQTIKNGKFYVLKMKRILKQRGASSAA